MDTYGMAASLMAASSLLLIFSLNKTPLGETGCQSNPYFFTYLLLRHPVF